MSEIAAKIKEQASHLSVEDRADIAYFLLHSLDCAEDEKGVHAAWEAELERRWAEVECGQAVGIPAEQALAQLRARKS
ncbi:MAG TPA: addiction module protein [Gemmataceae bacterium]|jgi:putative addiction module component (TIGR02574 family)|nr:addiction module protein [Gemmataceae bacterium]